MMSRVITSTRCEDNISDENLKDYGITRRD